MAKKKKKKLSAQQEFDIMKLVLDKFLWIGFIIMAFGLYKMSESTEKLWRAAVLDGVWYVVAGALVLFLFLWIIVKEYEFIK